MKEVTRLMFHSLDSTNYRQFDSPFTNIGLIYGVIHKSGYIVEDKNKFDHKTLSVLAIARAIRIQPGNRAKSDKWDD